MLQRYIGNKNALIDAILASVNRLATPGDLICDAFSGSTAVTMGLKAEGFRVATNDINPLSWVYSVAYLRNAELPPLNMKALTNRRSRRKVNPTSDWQSLLSYLTAPADGSLPESEWRSDFFENYCEAGSQSAFVSGRGLRGRRRFFSSENARAIDRALSRIRWWWRSKIIDEQVRCLLTACLLDAIEKVSNTQGTYHDFPRDSYDSRALRPISIQMPNIGLMAGSTDHIIGNAEDSLEFIRRVPQHSVLYLDPPYNFRQYTSYYFLPNIVARYPEIESLDDYFSRIDFVRGQNMDDDFSSTFCKAQKFMPSIKELVRRARCRYVLMSYFDGKNHWSDFKSVGDERGRQELESFFRSDVFVPGSMICTPIERLNYQSYGGYQAKTVTEFLFSAEKRGELSGYEHASTDVGSVSVFT